MSSFDDLTEKLREEFADAVAAEVNSALDDLIEILQNLKLTKIQTPVAMPPPEPKQASPSAARKHAKLPPDVMWSPEQVSMRSQAQQQRRRREREQGNECLYCGRRTQKLYCSDKCRKDLERAAKLRRPTAHGPAPPVQSTSMTPPTSPAAARARLEARAVPLPPPSGSVPPNSPEADAAIERVKASLTTPRAAFSVRKDRQPAG